MNISSVLRQPLADCASGAVGIEVALMRVLIEARTQDEALGAIKVSIDREASLDGRQRLERLRDLLVDTPGAPSIVRSLIDGVAHEKGEGTEEVGLARCAESFDRAVAVSPEASVALYSLGRPDLLAAATREIAAKMAEWGLLGGERDLLDIGCGIGRLEQALAPHLRAVTGIDISSGMIAEASRRCSGLANVRFQQSAGRDLSLFGDAEFDTVVAVDAMPYLVQLGGDLARRHVAEAFRVLRPGGRLLILNLSYRGDLEQDRRDVRTFADETGFTLLVDGTRWFAVWDGAAFLFAKPEGDAV